MLKINLKFLIIIAILTLFLDGYMFLIGSLQFKLYDIFCILPVLFFIFKDKKKFFITLVDLYNKTPFKYMVLFISWIIITAFFLFIANRAKILIFYSITIKLLPALLFCYTLSAYCLMNQYTLNKLIKFFLYIFLFVFISGLVLYSGDIFNISFIQHIQDAVSNVHLIKDGFQDMVDHSSGNYRLRGLFHEPAAYGKFILVFLPIIYSLCFTKFRIFKNKIISIFIKILLFSLTWVTLILIQSPIMFICCLIVTFLYFIVKNIRLTLFLFLLFVICFPIFVLLGKEIIFEHINILQDTFGERILNVFFATSFLDFLQIDTSLGFRIEGIINNIMLSFKSIIYGFGYDNSRYYMYHQLITSPIPIGREQLGLLTYRYVPGTGVSTYKSCLSELMVETGLVGTTLYYTLILKSIAFVSKLKKNLYGLERDFCTGLVQSYWTILIASIYITELTTPYIMFLLGLACFCYYKTATMRKLKIRRANEQTS